MKTLVIVLFLLPGLLVSKIGYTSFPGDVNEKSESNKLLTDWMDIQLFAIRNTKNPSHHFRQTCYTSIAFYESMVNSDSHYRSLAGQVNGLNSLPVPKGESISWPASGNAAMAEMLRFFYSDKATTTAKIDSMEKACLSQLLTDGNRPNDLEVGSAYGKSVAKAIIDWCKTDLSDKDNDAYTVPTGDGMWEPTPPKFVNAMRPWGGNGRTIVKASIENTLPPPPCDFSTDPSSDFYKMVNEVCMSVDSPGNEEKDIALFWDDAPDGTSIGAGGHWLSILKNVISSRNIPLIESAHIWAEMYIAMYDASIGCFKAKYTYNLIRPVTYVRKYMNRPDSNPLIVTPSHPEYPAAHATISMAAATVLAKLIGNEAGFVDHSYDYKGYKARTFESFTDAGKEAGMSRLYGGIHYRPSIEAGYALGERIANNVMERLEFTKR